MANKLHELLAVEQDRKHKATQALGDAKNTFTKKEPHFDGMVKRYIPLEEDSESVPDETKEIVTTVSKKLDSAIEAIVAGLDAQLSKEETNASGTANAELVFNGERLGTFSATSLLAIESYLTRVREVYAAIPVLDSAKKWSFDEQTGVYRTEPEVKFRSVKRPKVIVKYEATEKHPAQTELLYLDLQVGKYESVYSSGRLSSAQKAELLARIDALTEACKIARSKANTADVKNVKFGRMLFDSIHKGIL